MLVHVLPSRVIAQPFTFSKNLVDIAFEWTWVYIVPKHWQHHLQNILGSVLNSLIWAFFLCVTLNCGMCLAKLWPWMCFWLRLCLNYVCMTFCVHFVMHNIIQQSMREEKGRNVSGTLFLRLPLPGFAITIAGDHDRYRRMYWNKVDGVFLSFFSQWNMTF